ncbi:MAG: DUF881 domain-containing protein [Clostridium butyricum]|nr:DUF881 domain-containing protein [Clostridium butyricum]
MIKKSSSFFVFIAAVILGILISMNFNFERIRSPYTQLSSAQYQKAIEERNNLYKDIGNIKEDNIEMKVTINRYMREDEQNEKVLEDMKNQIMDYGLFTGVSQVEGPGIILKIDDGYASYSEEGTDEINNKLLHDSDMALILNELRNAGAEAISVNNHRVIPWSGVICNWAFIGFEDGSMEYAPFNIYVIGDPEKLKAAIMEDGSHIKQLIIRKLSVDIETRNKITMPATSSNGIIKYMERNEIQK